MRSAERPALGGTATLRRAGRGGIPPNRPTGAVLVGFHQAFSLQTVQGNTCLFFLSMGFGYILEWEAKKQVLVICHQNGLSKKFEVNELRK